jgi:hypothetical protein
VEREVVIANKTAGASYPSSATEAAVQANVVAAGYTT